MGIFDFSSDGSLLATGAGDKTIRIWDIAKRQLVREATFDTNVGNAAFSSDGKLLACGTWDGHCRLWDLAGGKEVRRLRNDPKGDYSLYAIFAPNGGPLAVWGYEDRSVRLFDAKGVKEIRRFNAEGTEKVKPSTPWGWVHDIHARFSPSGKILAIFRDLGRIELWDVESGKKLHTLACDRSHTPSFLVFSPDSTKLATAGGDLWRGDHTIRLWDVTNGKEVHPLIGHGAPISSVAIAPDGKTIATAGRDGFVHIWDRNSAKNLLRLEGHPGKRRQVSFSSDGQRVASWETYGQGALRVWDTKTGQPVSRLQTQSTEAMWTAVSCNGNTVLSFDQKEKSVRFRSLDTGKVIREFANTAVYPIALSPTGKSMVCSDGNLRNADDRKELLAVGHMHALNPSIRFSADGRRLVAAQMEKRLEKLLLSDPPAEEIAVIDAIGGKELRRFSKKMGNELYVIEAIALSQDGKMVVTSLRDRRRYDGPTIIALWETETGRERGHFVGHRGQTKSVAISADGRFLVTGSDDTTALVWDATRPRAKVSFLRRESAAMDMAAHLEKLAGKDAEEAYVSLWALRGAAQKTVAFLAKQSNLFARTDVRAIERWIGDLDSSEFAQRERASQQLGWILDEAEPYLKKALENKPSLEMRLRIELLLHEKGTGPTGWGLQRLRVVEVLEHIAAEGAEATRLAAIALLKKFAAGAAGSRPTQEAKASLERLENRP